MGTITDIDGNYTLDVPSGASLQVSYIGYLTQDVVTAGKNNIDINLIEDTQNWKRSWLSDMEHKEKEN